MKNFFCILSITILIFFSCKKNNSNTSNLSESVFGETGVLNSDENGSIDFFEDENILEEKNEILPESEPESIAEKSLKNAEGMLRLFSYDVEQFLVLGEKERKTIQYADGKATRKFFDESFRLQKKEFWTIGKTLDTSKKESEEFFYYEEENVIPFRSEKKTENTRLENFFDKNGVLKEQHIYEINLDQKNNSNQSAQSNQFTQSTQSKGESLIEKLVQKSFWKYDEKNRIAEEVHITFAEKSKKEISQFEKKMNYKYDDDGLLLEYNYFEDGFLRIKTNYQTEDTYTTFLFFDNGYNVEAFYSNGKKVKEIFMYNENVLRVREYE